MFVVLIEVFWQLYFNIIKTSSVTFFIAVLFHVINISSEMHNIAYHNNESNNEIAVHFIIEASQAIAINLLL